MESIELISEDKTRQKKEKKINAFRSLISIDKNCAKLEYKQDIWETFDAYKSGRKQFLNIFNKFSKLSSYFGDATSRAN